MKNSNEYSKKVALLEQERDFLRNDLNNLKEVISRKEFEERESHKTMREKEEKLKTLK